MLRLIWMDGRPRFKAPFPREPLDLNWGATPVRLLFSMRTPVLVKPSGHAAFLTDARQPVANASA